MSFSCAELFAYLSTCWTLRSGLSANYRPIHDADPGSWPQNQRFKYSKNTSTTSIRRHIEKVHFDEYMDLCKANNWRVLLPGLTSRARTQAASEASASGRRPEVEFSLQKFHQSLLKFIIADDQVCEHCISSQSVQSCVIPSC